MGAAHSVRGTEVAALFDTIVESAMLNGLDPRAHLRAATVAALTGETVSLARTRRDDRRVEALARNPGGRHDE